MYFKIVKNNYIMAAGIGNTATKISEAEYDAILGVIKNSTEAKDGFALMLKDSTLEWEYVPVEPEPLTEEESLTRYANTLTGANDPDLISAAETLIEQRIKEEQ